MTTRYRVEQIGPEPVQPKRIDYERMRREWPKQKAALTRAAKTGDAAKVAKVCVDAVTVWDQIGAWPDDWSLFERTLNDLLGWRDQTTLTDLAYGRARLVPIED